MKPALILSLTLGLVPLAGAEGRNALELLDAFIAAQAADNAAYRTDLQPGGGPGKVPQGRRLSSGPVLGPFTYRPKTYSELSPALREALLADPRLHSFIAGSEQEKKPGGAASRDPLPRGDARRGPAHRSNSAAMMPSDPALPTGIDPVQLQEILSVVHEQVTTALWLSAGMVLAVAQTVLVAFGLRRAALSCALLYCASLCFVRNGHAQILGPMGCAAAVSGLLHPRGRAGASGESPR